LSLFDTDPGMLAAGTAYLRAVGPAYGFFGLGMALYFASQGAGRLLWPVLAGTARLLIAVIGGYGLLRLSGRLDDVFYALAAALVVFGAVNAASIFAGAWFRSRD
jgi:Na+-driven multidrug efflux pump